jgi:hypothetical protein
MREELIRDVMAQVGDIHIMNASNPLGYLFNPNKGEYEIATGMYCSNYKEIDHNKWTYFFSFTNKVIRNPKNHTLVIEHKNGKFYRLYENIPGHLGFGESNGTFLEELLDDYKMALAQ